VGVINYITDSKLEFNEKEDKLDMCKGLDEFAARAKAEGKAEGIAEGALEQEKKNIKTMHKNGFAPEVIAKALSLNINYVKEVLAN
jgi:predicted transposase/invertase (TIGR01784 family)